MRRAAFLICVVTLFFTGALPVLRAHGAATVTVIAGPGFNDSTAVAPVGGNTGTTVGDQRLIAFQYAANLWGQLIDSPVTIRVSGSFVALECNNTSGVLGSAGPTTVHRDFAGAPLASTWYVQALANSLFGGDLSSGQDDIETEFNSNIGTPGCLSASGWYYGLDGNTPAGKIDFVTVLLHELGHGLGFLNLVSLSSGAKFNNLNDAYMVHLEDHTTGKSFPAMNNTERYNAVRKPGSLHWTGANVMSGGAGLLDGRHATGHIEMYAPASVESGSSVSHFSTDLSPHELMEPFYTGANHDVGLALELMADLGWSVSIPTIDVTPPARIASLKKVSSTLTSIELSWKAPGDDGSLGTASAYDLRMSSAPINESNWAAASQVVGEPLPGAADTLEGITVSGLLCSRNYYFAIKTSDDSDNVSILSNVARAATLPCPRLLTSPAVLPDAQVGLAYNASYTISGGVGPYAIQVLSGLPEPAGLTLVGETVSGTPTAVSTWKLTVQITDQIGSTARKTFRLRIRPPAQIVTSALAAGLTGRSYKAVLRASGGTRAYNWSLVGGTLPAGISFDGVTGRISGVPASPASSDLTFQLLDGAGASVQRTLSLVIN